MHLRQTVCEVSTVFFIIAAGAALYWNTFSFFPSLLPGYPGDAFFPQLSLAFLFFCCVVFLLRHALHRLRGEEDPVAAGETVEIPLPRFFAVIVIVCAYVYLLPVAGFELSTFAFVFVTMTTRLRGSPVRQVLKGIALALVTTLLCYAIFVMALNVSLPLKILPRITL